MLGKQKCKILKQIRQKIADENDIPYVTRECGFRGECRGTCPRCESELRYLEQQLALRASLGKRVAVAALCASMSLGAAGCSSPFDRHERPDETELSGMVAYNEPADTPEPDVEILGAEIACSDPYKDLGKRPDAEPSKKTAKPWYDDREIQGGMTGPDDEWYDDREIQGGMTETDDEWYDDPVIRGDVARLPGSENHG